MIVKIRDFLSKVLGRLVLRNDGSLFSLFLCLSALVLEQLVSYQHIKHEDLIRTDLNGRIQLVEQPVSLQEELALLSTHPKSVILEVGIQAKPIMMGHSPEAEILLHYHFNVLDSGS